jgi:hypothetical protein
MDNVFSPVSDGDNLVKQLSEYAIHFVAHNRATVLSSVFVDALQAVYGFQTSEELKLMSYAIGDEMARIASQGHFRGVIAMKDDKGKEGTS